MEIQVMTESGEPSGTSLTVCDGAFDRAFNESLVHQVVVAYLAGGRSGTKAQRSRSDVRGGGAKPWRQKGTGRARAGTSRSPIWRSGGVTFAARPRNHDQKVNRKMYRAAMRAIVSQLLRDERILVVDEFAVTAPKTKELAGKLGALELSQALVVTDQVDEALYLASRNLPGVSVVDADGVDPVSLLQFDKIVMTAGAIKRLDEVLK